MKLDPWKWSTVTEVLRHNKLRVFLFVLCVLILLNVTLWPRQLIWSFGVQRSNHSGLQLKCQNVLDNMVKGHWVRNAHTQAELDEIQLFLNKTRKYHKIPFSLQREDKKCGNVNFPGLQWIRAVCNPVGSEPCCYNNQCESKTEEECRCPHCYDMRQQIHAELSTWIPSEPTCQMIQFTGEKDACKVLHNMTIYFIGDSFMRQVATSVLGLLRSSKEDGSVNDKLPLDQRKTCDKYYRYFCECKGAILSESLECNKTVRVKRESLWRASQSSSILKMMEELSGKPDSLILFGIGVHDSFNLKLITEQVFNPMFDLLSKSPWPRLVWMANHAPGLLKTGLVPQQQSPSVLRYNSEVKAIMDKQGIPILNFYQLTSEAMSYDGSHYGKGVNDVKVQIFLNYLLEMRLNSTLFSPLHL